MPPNLSKRKCSGRRKITKKLARHSKYYAIIKFHDEATDPLSELTVDMLKEEQSQRFLSIFPSFQETGNNTDQAEASSFRN